MKAHTSAKGVNEIQTQYGWHTGNLRTGVSLVNKNTRILCQNIPFSAIVLLIADVDTRLETPTQLYIQVYRYHTLHARARTHTHVHTMPTRTQTAIRITFDAKIFQLRFFPRISVSTNVHARSPPLSILLTWYFCSREWPRFLDDTRKT